MSTLNNVHYFYVASQGGVRKNALKRVKEALELYLTDNAEHIKSSEMGYTEEEVIQKAKDLFLEFSSPEEEPSRVQISRNRHLYLSLNV